MDEAVKSVVNTPQVRKMIADIITLGGSTKEIAEVTGIDEDVVKSVVKTPEMRLMIKEQTERLVKALPDAVDVIMGIINEYSPDADPRVKSLSYKASKDVLRATGIMASKPESYTVNTEIHNQMNMTVTNDFKVIIDEFRKNMNSVRKLIEAEYSE